MENTHQTMYTTPRRSVLRLVLIVLGLFISGACHAMSILDGQIPLQNPWKERFQDVAKLNDYAKTHPVEIANSKIENHKIDGAILNGGKFENTYWKKVSAQKTNLTKVVFRKGIIEDVDFSDSTLTDVVFEDVKLRGLRFFHATLRNVKFIRCTFNGINIDQTKNSQIEVIDSKAISSSFSEGQLIAVFRNSKLYDGVELTDLIPPSSLTFEKSELDDVNMERSKLKELVINDTKFNSIFDVGSADNITVNNSTLKTSISAATVGTISINNTEIKGLSILRSKIKTVTLMNCGKMYNFGMLQSTIGTLTFSHCPLDDFRPIEATFDVLSIKDGSLANSDFEKMKAKTMILENVSLDGKLDFTNAHVTDLQTKNVIKQPGLQLLTTGSNVRF